jgi:hypothetical protein
MGIYTAVKKALEAVGVAKSSDITGRMIRWGEEVGS